LNLTELSKQIHENNKLKGFDASKENVGQSLMLIVSELGEAVEAHRNNRFADMVNYPSAISTKSELFKEHFKLSIKDTFEDELADSIIRLLDLCGALNIDIETHVKLKTEYNKTRSFMHGNKSY